MRLWLDLCASLVCQVKANVKHTLTGDVLVNIKSHDFVQKNMSA